MAFNDTLFQLGMDLTRSSTAQKEDLNVPARVASDERIQSSFERDSVRFAGSHLIVDLFGAKHLDNAKQVEGTLRRCVEAAGATLLDMQLHRSQQKIATGVASLDIYMSGDADSYRCVDALRAAFGAREVVLKTHKRCAALPPHVLEIATRKAAKSAAAKVTRAPRTKKAA